MQVKQDTTQDLRKCTVAIQRSNDGKVLGTGVIVTNDGLILTCYHVIGDIKNKILDEFVDICFPSILEIRGHAYPIKEYCDPELDIAFLQLREKIPEQTSVVELGDTLQMKE